MSCVAAQLCFRAPCFRWVKFKLSVALNVLLVLAVLRLFVENVELELQIAAPTKPAACATDPAPVWHDPVFPMPPPMYPAMPTPFLFHMDAQLDLKLPTHCQPPQG